jgi:hypothetical protein
MTPLEEAVAREIYHGFLQSREPIDIARHILALPEIVKMQEALEPFAAEANSWDESIANDASVEIKAEGDDGCDVASFDVGDLRRAREAYLALQPLKKEAE